MSYQRRMSIASGAALLIHLTAVAVVAFYPRPSGPGMTVSPEKPPLVVNLQPTPRQLVDVATPSETRPDQSNRIAETNSVATDTELREGDDGPLTEMEQDFDAIATTATAGAVAPATEAPPEAEPERTPPVTEEAREAAEAPPVMEETAPAPESTARSQVARRTPEPVTAPPIPVPAPEPSAPRPPEAQRPAQESPERNQTARAEPPPGIPAAPAEQTAPIRGRSRGGVRETGVAGFEAIQDDIAPYLRQVRAAVEREWTTTLATRYTGTRPTEAVVECEIAPDGTVVRAEIIGTPSDRIYAAICQTSIIRAGPFGPFPFDIPDMYRNRNLKIRWSFSFISR